MILDTNALSAIAGGQPDATRTFAAAVPARIPVIVLGEYRFGISLSRHKRRYEGWLDEVVSVSKVLEVDEETAVWYAELRVQLESGYPDSFQRCLDWRPGAPTRPPYPEPGPTFRLDQGNQAGRLVSSSGPPSTFLSRRSSAQTPPPPDISLD